MRVLIIGGTGFIGPQVVLSLLELGHEVTLFHRGETRADLPEEVRHIHGNRRHMEDSRKELTGLCPDVVVDMFALCEWDTRSVIDTFKDVAGRLVTVSSQDVYRAYGKVIRIESGPPETVPLTEDSPLRTKLYPYREEMPRDRNDPHKYLDDYDKIPVEQATMGEPELPGTVVRLPMVYGQRDAQHRLFNYLKRMDDGRPAIILDEGIAGWRASRGYVENVGKAVALASVEERATGRIYNIAEPEAQTMADWVKKIGEAAGWSGEIAVVPADSLPASLVADMNTDQDLAVDSSRIREELGFEEPVTLEEGLRRTVFWQRRFPPGKVDSRSFDYATEDAVLARLT
jgi:nucleoside-diphosphate-sugar epimerase